MTRERPQLASAPSELVTPGTARAASSAAMARAISVSGVGSAGSTMSSWGQLRAQADIIAFRALELLGVAEALGVAQRHALEQHGICVIGAGAARLGDERI